MSSQQGTASDVFSRPPPRQSMSTTPDHPLAAPSSAGVELSEQPRPAAAPASALFPATAPVTIASTPASPARTLDDLVDDFVQSRPAPPPLPESMPELERLVVLTQRRSWQDVVIVCRNLLQSPSSHYAPLYEALLMGRANSTVVALETHQRDLVYILHCYQIALIKLGNYHELVLEIERWSFCHHNDRTAPEWVPWSLHIAAASTLQFVPKEARSDAAAQVKAYATCLDALWAIRSDILVPKSSSNNDDDIATAALMQVENAIANVFTAKKEWRMVLSCYQRMLDRLPDIARDEAAQLKRSMKLTADPQVVKRGLELTYKAELLSRQGRILLQAGALDAAEQIFAQASTTFNETLDDSSKDILSDHAAVQHIPALLKANDGLYQFSLGQYDAAMDLFQATVEHLRAISTSVSPAGVQFNSEAGITTASRENLYSETINNMALAALYTCRLNDALELMESLVKENVTAYLTARVALNLSTLYELASESAYSARKKRVLQLVAKRFELHDIPAECFRVN